MKKITTLLNIVALSALFTTGNLSAQSDSVRVKTTTSETVTTGTSPTPATPPATVAATPPPAPAPVATEEPKDEKSPLRKTELGFRYYPTFSSLKVQSYNGEVINGSLSMSNGYGVFLGHNFNRHVGLVLEVDYNEISQKYKDRNLNREVHISYLNIPLMLSLNTDKTCWVNWNFVAGPQFGLNLGSSVKTTGSDSLKATVAVKAGDVGLAYGTGLEFALNREHTVRIDVGYRGFFGLVDMNAKQTNTSPDTYNIMVKAARRYYAGYIGLTFAF